MGKHIKDPAAPIPDYIEINNRRWNIQELLDRPQTQKIAPRGYSMRFRLLEPYSQWPAGFARYITGCQMAQRVLNGEVYTSCMFLTPAWHRQDPLLRKIVTRVPFVAVRFSVKGPDQRYFWGFWFRSDLERDQCCKESPDGQWLATGHRLTTTIFKKETQNDQDNLLYAHYGGSPDRIQEY